MQAVISPGRAMSQLSAEALQTARRTILVLELDRRNLLRALLLERVDLEAEAEPGRPRAPGVEVLVTVLALDARSDVLDFAEGAGLTAWGQRPPAKAGFRHSPEDVADLVLSGALRR